MTTKDVLNSIWFVLDKPWGDGTAVLAGDSDPHGGVLVCKNEFAAFNPEGYEDISIREIMAYIVTLHNRLVIGAWR